MADYHGGRNVPCTYICCIKYICNGTRTMHTWTEPRTARLSVHRPTRGLRVCACVSRATLLYESSRDTSPRAQAVRFKHTASQSVNSESDLSLRGPESTAWCTTVPTSGSLHCPMLQFVPCFQGAWGDGNRAEVHGHPWTLIAGLTVLLSLFLSFFSFFPRLNIDVRTDV